MRSMKEGTGFDPQNYAEAGMAKKLKQKTKKKSAFFASKRVLIGSMKG